MNLLSLPDEILCQICNHLNIFDFLSLVQIPEFGLRAQKFYRFYYDESHRECKRFGEQELKKRFSLEAYPLHEYIKINDSDVLAVHLLFGDCKDRIINKVIEIAKRVPNKITSLAIDSREFMGLQSVSPGFYDDFNKVQKLKSHSSLIKNLSASPLTKSTSFSLEDIYLFDQELGLEKLEFPNLSNLKLQNCVAINKFSKFKIPCVKNIQVFCEDRHVSILNNFAFEEYNFLKKFEASIDIDEGKESEIIIENLKFKNCEDAKFLIRSKSCEGKLQNISFGNLKHLKVENIKSFINIDAPNLIDLELIFGGEPIDDCVNFTNFSAPKLLSIKNENCLGGYIHVDKFENFHAPMLQQLQIDEFSLCDTGSFFFENLQSIVIHSYAAWHGKFNPSNVVHLELISGKCRDSYDALTYTDFPSLRELMVEGKEDADFFDLADFPFTRSYPNVTYLELDNFINIQSSSLNECLSRFPNLKQLDLYPNYKLGDFKIEGLCCDKLKRLEISPVGIINNIEITNCQFKNLKSFKLDTKRSVNPDEQSSYTANGKLDFIAPNLVIFDVDVNMDSLNLSNFQCCKIKTITLKGVVFDIGLGDIGELEELKITRNFGRLSHTNLPLSIEELSLPSNEELPYASMSALKELYSKWVVIQNENGVSRIRSTELEEQQEEEDMF